MAKPSSKVWVQVGVEPEARLRWLLRFGNLDLDSLTVEERAAVLEEARVFVFLQEADPALRGRMRFWPAPTDATPDVLTKGEAWSAQLWLKQGLDLLTRSEKWNFMPRVTYELDAYKGFVLGPYEGKLSSAAFQGGRMTLSATRGSNFASAQSANGRLYRSGARGIAPRAALKRSEPGSGAKRIPRRTARSDVSNIKGQWPPNWGCPGARRSRLPNAPRITEIDDNGRQTNSAANRAESHVA
jgi:hypothetical protein